MSAGRTEFRARDANGGVVVDDNVSKRPHRIHNNFLALVGGVVVVAIISSALGGGSKSTSSDSSRPFGSDYGTGQHTYRFADRAD